MIPRFTQSTLQFIMPKYVLTTISQGDSIPETFQSKYDSVLASSGAKVDKVVQLSPNKAIDYYVTASSETFLPMSNRHFLI